MYVLTLNKLKSSFAEWERRPNCLMVWLQCACSDMALKPPSTRSRTSSLIHPSATIYAHHHVELVYCCGRVVTVIFPHVHLHFATDGEYALNKRIRGRTFMPSHHDPYSPTIVARIVGFAAKACADRRWKRRRARGRWRQRGRRRRRR